LTKIGEDGSLGDENGGTRELDRQGKEKTYRMRTKKGHLRNPRENPMIRNKTTTDKRQLISVRVGPEETQDDIEHDCGKKRQRWM